MHSLSPRRLAQRNTAAIRSNEISPAFRHLFSRIRRDVFGRIEKLHIRNGQPVFDPPPLVRSTYKLTRSTTPRPSCPPSDSELEQQQAQLVAYFAQIGDGVIDRIEFAHGCPFFFEVVDTLTV